MAMVRRRHHLAYPHPDDRRTYPHNVRADRSASLYHHVFAICISIWPVSNENCLPAIPIRRTVVPPSLAVLVRSLSVSLRAPSLVPIYVAWSSPVHVCSLRTSFDWSSPDAFHRSHRCPVVHTSFSSRTDATCRPPAAMTFRSLVDPN